MQNVAPNVIPSKRIAAVRMYPSLATSFLAIQKMNQPRSPCGDWRTTAAVGEANPSIKSRVIVVS
jgi:hypothetical protein